MSSEKYRSDTSKTIKNPLLSAAVTGLTFDDFTHNAVLMPAAAPLPVELQTPITTAETKSVSYGAPVVALSDSFSDISLEPSSEPPISAFGTTSSLSSNIYNPLQDIDTFDNTDPRYTAPKSEPSQLDSIFNPLAQASALTASLSQTLPTVASTVFTTFSNIVKGRSQPPGQFDQTENNKLGPTERPPEPNVIQQQQYKNPLDELYDYQVSHYNTSLTTDQINQSTSEPVPLLYSPQDPTIQGVSLIGSQPSNSNNTGGNTFRLTANKKKTYAPVPGLASSSITTPLPQQISQVQSNIPLRPPACVTPQQQSTVQSNIFPPALPSQQQVYQDQVGGGLPGISTTSAYINQTENNFGNQLTFQSQPPQQQQQEIQPQDTKPQSKFSLSSFFSTPLLDRFQKPSQQQQQQQQQHQQGQQSDYNNQFLVTESIESVVYSDPFATITNSSINDQLLNTNQPSSIAQNFINPAYFNTAPIQQQLTTQDIPSNLKEESVKNQSLSFNPLTTAPEQKFDITHTTPTSVPFFNPSQVPPVPAVSAPPPPSVAIPSSTNPYSNYRLSKKTPLYKNPLSSSETIKTPAFLPEQPTVATQPLSNIFNPSETDSSSVSQLLTNTNFPPSFSQTITPNLFPPPPPPVETTSAFFQPIQPLPSVNFFETPYSSQVDTVSTSTYNTFIPVTTENNSVFPPPPPPLEPELEQQPELTPVSPNSEEIKSNTVPVLPFNIFTSTSEPVKTLVADQALFLSKPDSPKILSSNNNKINQSVSTEISSAGELPPPPPPQQRSDIEEQQSQNRTNIKDISITEDAIIAEEKTNLNWFDVNKNIDSVNETNINNVSSVNSTIGSNNNSTSNIANFFYDSIVADEVNKNLTVNDNHSSFFDCPPDIKPDEYRQHNYFTNFLHKESTEESGFIETNAINSNLTSLSLQVEPSSIDDSKLSVSSFPSFDQSQVSTSRLFTNEITSASPIETLDGAAIETSNQNNQINSYFDKSLLDSTIETMASGTITDDVDGGVNGKPAVTTIYRPVYKHWFYKQKVDSKPVWTPFSMTDSMALEEIFQANDENKRIIATDGGRHDVDIVARTRTSIYWSSDPCDVRRCSWFYKAIDSRYVPYEETEADILEEEYKDAFASGQWHRRVTLSNGELVTFHGPTVMVHFLQAQTPDSLGNTPQTTNRPRVVKRGVDEFNIEDGEPEKIDHVLFMVHGIGAACDFKFRTVEEVVDEFRSIALQMTQSHYRSSSDSGEIGRIEVLPVSWHSELHSEEFGIDAKLKSITLESIPKLRNFTNETLLDVLFYTSPIFCQSIMDTVSTSINKCYNLFRERNPTYQGGISLAGHSLGSLILFDLLCHQKPHKPHDDSIEKENSENPDHDQEEEVHHEHIHRPLSMTTSQPINYTMGPAGTGQPFISYPHLHFSPKSFFALGSPIGMFVTIRGLDALGLDFKLPTTEYFYNIFHPYDPVAYRIEALVNPDLASLRPVLIPHHKGRKRMHLELRETITRVGADIKQKIFDTFKSTIDTVNQLKNLNKTDTQAIEQQVDQVLNQQLNMDSSSRPRSSSTGSNAQSGSDCDSGETDLPLGQLNKTRRIDYVLQEAPLEFFNEYLFALTSHVCYWNSEDTILFVVKEIYSSMGMRTDNKIPQQSLTIERPSGSGLSSYTLLPADSNAFGLSKPNAK